MHASHAAGCPCWGWHYENYDKKKEKVKARCFDQLVALRKKETSPLEAADTRAAHALMFRGLTHPDCPYFAGNYRGSRDCLVRYEVQVGPATTQDSTGVLAAMTAFSTAVTATFQALSEDTALTGADLLVSKIDVILDRMVEFLAIHPYADGNGHMSRFIVWCFLAALNLWPKRWPMDDRPPQPYDDHIRLYRLGIKDPLREYVLRLLLKKAH